MDNPTTVEISARRWPVDWSAIWVGALTALAVGLIIGLIGYAVGAHDLASRGVDWKHLKFITLVFSIAGAFFAFVAGGWVAARIGGFERAETAMLHASIAWLVAVPLLLVIAGLGGASGYGGWYGGLAVRSLGPATVDPALAQTFRNTALATVASLLIGLIGSVIGGWMASGEPMTLTYYRRRTAERPVRARRIA
jgi:hypothetical protein